MCKTLNFNYNLLFINYKHLQIVLQCMCNAVEIAGMHNGHCMRMHNIIWTMAQSVSEQ